MRAWLTLLVGPLAMLVAAVIDPFGVESAADTASLTSFQRLYAPFYPQARQDDIVVVTIANEDLPLSPEAAIDWPPRFDDYAHMIDVIAGVGDLKPAGVFFDFLLDRMQTAGNAVDGLCAAIARAADRGVAVTFAAHPDLGAPQAFAACKVPPTIVSATWRAAEGAYGLSYDIAGARVLTAAADLYRRSLGASVAAFDAAVAKNEELTIMWGSRPPVYDPDCTAPAAEGERWRQSLSLFISGIGLDPEARRIFMRQQKCLYHAKIAARLLMDAAAPAQQRLAARLFNGKYVLVGAALSDGLDYHPSPVHGSAPGVFVHAMALDNLLTYGPDFFRRPAEARVAFTKAKVGADALLQAAILFALACAMALLARRLPAGDRLARLGAGALARFNAAIVLVIFVASAVAFTALGLHWTPINWGGVLIAGLLMIAPWNFIRDGDDRPPDRTP